ncbi:MAG: hypothetical protein IJ061_04895 [Lachnospiraceae bacterium]|nr:hypothetical protein [Lachnospiraceae bacterium]
MIQLLLSFIAAYYMLVFLYYILSVIGKWKIFVKMGEPGWFSLIPFLNDYFIFRHCWDTTAFFAMLFCSAVVLFLGPSDPAEEPSMLVNLASMAVFVLTFLKNIKLSRSFGHGYLYAFGLMVLNPVFSIILGFGNSRYLGNTTGY